MESMDVEKLLYQVKEGSLSIEEAQKMLRLLPYEDLGCARLDHHRRLRTGFSEVVFCQGKEPEHLKRIWRNFRDRKENAMGTRASKEQAELLLGEIPELMYDPVSRILKLVYQKPEPIGRIAVCSAGTADIPVAEEAAQTVEFFGGRAERYFDIGVAGIHRLLAVREELDTANCIIAVAGMEGALASVLAGLVDKPVVAVPTSIGYGASFGGVSALLTMINSCANGISVVNIDNGYGAGYVASQINRLVEKKDE